MKVYHVEFAKTGTGLSGGEKSMIEVIRYFETQKLNNVLLTTDNGRKTYEKLGLIENEHLSYVVIASYDSEKRHHIFISYLFRLYYFLRVKKQIVDSIDRDNDILMCHSDFFPNTIPTWLLSKYFKKNTFWWFHMLAPNIFRGFEGQYTGKFQLPNFRIIHYKLNQILFFALSKKGIIISINPYYDYLFNKRKTYILKKFGGENIYTIKKYSGVGPTLDNTAEIEKKYDLVFMGRFHAQKGLLEIPKILQQIKEKKPDIKLAIIGGGEEKIKAQLFEAFNKAGLASNINYLGFISSDEKFEHLRESKVFIFPSYYESFGQVALEAMANGLPVIAYDLPVFGVFNGGMKKVPILDNSAFANEALKLLNDSVYYEAARIDALKSASEFSWSITGKEIFDLLQL